jgi:hypothetical protein
LWKWVRNMSTSPIKCKKIQIRTWIRWRSKYIFMIMMNKSIHRIQEIAERTLLPSFRHNTIHKWIFTKNQTPSTICRPKSLIMLKSKISKLKSMMIILSLTAIIWKIHLLSTLKIKINPKLRTRKCSKIHSSSYLLPMMKVKNATIYKMSLNQDNSIKQGRHSNSTIKMNIISQKQDFVSMTRSVQREVNKSIENQIK